jgi:hypothetical protein
MKVKCAASQYKAFWSPQITSNPICELIHLQSAVRQDFFCGCIVPCEKVQKKRRSSIWNLQALKLVKFWFVKKRPDGSSHHDVPEVIFVPMFTNLFLMMLPNEGIAVTKAKAIAEAISAYSIAVAPDWSCIKFLNLFIPFS